MNLQKGSISIILIIVAVVALFSVATYFVITQQIIKPSPTLTPTPATCAQEAKQCPDGSYVSHTGPNCEFAKCPETNLVACSHIAKQCPDGSYVSRTGPNCEFTKCPNPVPLPNGKKIIKTVGEEEGSFLIQRINPDSVEGLWTNAYPIPGDSTPKTIRIGDNIGYACEGISEKLTSINFSGQTITFTKVVGKPPFGSCPLCLAKNTLIDTPNGALLVQNLQNGMPIWTVDPSGNRILAVIIKTAKTPVPPGHQMVHIILDDKREIFASPGHPIGDGRVFNDLAVGDILDGSRIIISEKAPYNKGYAYDILPSGKTGLYFANGIIIDSTLH